ncbi:FecR family protein [Parapedobacter koreensis]|uniref:FecR family protein n=1 Tax=Parapedobacter koreensis TaxID=332977 RepID=A0A1H7SRJ2_9SPHI|nr:FecR family protein [Parapedobacter koreensis]SEL75078.1 FecR family protein [Parapedobacter koreensis]
MKPLLFKELIDRYRNGEATPSERELVERWLEQQREKPLSLDTADEQRIKTEMLSVIRKQLRATRIRRLGMLIRVAAAAVLVVALAALGWRLGPLGDTAPTMYAAQTNSGERKQVILPDRSVIWLNANSLVEYPEDFGRGERTVRLIRGEAFFEVTPDPSKPFAVKTEWFETRVLGTSFNVQVQPDTDEMGVAVETGKVEVRPVDTARRQEVFRLMRGEGVLYSRATHAMSHTTGSEKAGIWRTGGLSFMQRSLNDVIRALEDKYATTIVLDVDPNRDYRFTATLTPQTTLDEVLASVCLVNKLVRVDGGSAIVLRERNF